MSLWGRTFRFGSETITWSVPEAGGSLRALLQRRAWAESLAADRERLPLWIPLLLACGIAGYFALPIEPPAVLLLAPTLLLVVWWGGWPTVWPLPRLAMAVMLTGFACASWQIGRLHTPVLRAPAIGMLWGRIEELAPSGRGWRITMAACPGHALLRGSHLRKVALAVRTAAPADLAVGDAIRVFAALSPLARPRYPGGYDPGRRAWLRGIGATGYALQAVHRLGPQTQGCGRVAGRLARALHVLRRGISRLRMTIAARVRAGLPPREAGLAVALLTGQRGQLARADVAAMRDAGLAHLLAISGLHLGLVAVTVFWLVRLLLALWPRHAESHDGKRPAAIAALIAITGYLLVSGASIATTRAFVMTGLGLIAVMLRRDPFSLRLLAFAATVLLLMRPSDLLEPGFQMSFAAVAALIGVYEMLARRGGLLHAVPATGPARRIFRYLATVMITTMIAEIAIAPFAIHHFGTIARYGLLANLIAVPATAFLVMPAGLIALLLMPLGWEQPALWAMGQGTRLVLAIAHAVADLPGAVWHLPSFPAAALLLIALAGSAAVIWRAPLLRTTAMLPLVAAFAMIVRTTLPDVLVGEAGKLMALRDGARLWVTSRRAERGSRLAWEQALGVTGSLRFDRPPKRNGMAMEAPLTCTEDGLCVAKVETAAGPRRIALWRGHDPERLAAMRCRGLDVLVVAPDARPPPADCRPMNRLISADALRRDGVHAFFVDRASGAIAFGTVRAARGTRPWSR